MSGDFLAKPDFIETAQDFYRLIKFGETYESLTLDFKKDLSGYQVGGPQARAAQKELCRDLAQFANTFGGCLLLGVEEGHHGTKKVAARIHSIDDFDTRRQWIEQAVQNFLIPSTMPFEILPINLSEGNIISIKVPPHQHLVWVWEKETKTMQCVRRTNHGKEYLNPDEAEAHLMDSSRACKLAFSRVVNAAIGKNVQLLSGVWTVTSGGAIGSSPLLKLSAEVSIGATSDYEFELRVRSSFLNNIVSVRIPYGLIQETWLTSELQIGLLLKFRLVTSQARDSITMEPL